VTVPVALWTPSYCAVADWTLPHSHPGSMRHTTIPTAPIGELQDAPLKARVYLADGSLIEPADVSLVLVRVYDADGVEQYATELLAADAILDAAGYALTLSDAAWTADGDGYNLTVTIPGRDVFRAGGSLYRVEVTTELADGDALTIVGRLMVRPALTYQENLTT
jgi:hypothetical protein